MLSRAVKNHRFTHPQLLQLGVVLLGDEALSGSLCEYSYHRQRGICIFEDMCSCVSAYLIGGVGLRPRVPTSIYTYYTHYTHTLYESCLADGVLGSEERARYFLKNCSCVYLKGKPPFLIITASMTPAYFSCWRDITESNRSACFSWFGLMQRI